MAADSRGAGRLFLLPAGGDGERREEQRAHQQCAHGRNLTTLAACRPGPPNSSSPTSTGTCTCSTARATGPTTSASTCGCRDAAGFFVPLRIEGWGAKPALELDGWEHVAEFSLELPSGTLALASGDCGAVNGRDRARRLPRALERAARGEHRLSSGPGPAAAPPPSELRAPDGQRSDLGDMPGAARRRRRVGRRLDRRHPRARQRAAALPPARAPDRPHVAADDPLRRRGPLAGGERGRSTTRALHGEHPGLLPFADERGGLSFNGRPAEPERLAHALRAAHAERRGPAHRVRGRARRAARGRLRPARERARSRSCAATRTSREEHGVATHLTVTGPGRNGLALLELGESFVVAERFSVSCS